MAISFACPHCRRSLNVRDAAAGSRGKCPQCTGVVQVPSASETPAKAVSAAASATKAVASRPAATGAATTRAPAAQQVPAPAVAAPVNGARPAAKQQAATAAPASPTDALAMFRRLTPEQRRAAVLGGFHGTFERAPVRLSYRLGALLTAGCMLLLPLVYLAIIAGVIWLVGYHATHHTGILTAVRGKGAVLAFLVYLAPLVVGGISIFFMIKPLFARPAQRSRTRSLTPHSDPLLFEFVENVCARVGAPTPRRIDIDCEVNASASFRRGMLSLLLGRDMVLTIGMPLAAGMSLQQFAGILGHEFGHFAQGAGMRLTYLIRSVNFWFVRVVYQRDSWDAWLANSTSDMDLRIAWILWLAQACVWMTRKILWLLMMAGHAVSGYMMRQMEFDADRYETRLVGSDAFEAETKQLLLLNFAYRGAQSDLGSFFREGRLPDNLPRLIMNNVRHFPAEVQETVSTLIDESNTGLFDTHPSDKERVASAREENAPGVFRSDLPAAVLFTNFDSACTGVTLDFYHSIFGMNMPPGAIQPVEELISQQDAQLELYKARDRFFLNAFCPLRPLRMPEFYLSQPGDPRQVKGAIALQRERMLKLAAAYDANQKAYDKLDDRLLEALQAACLYSNEMRPPRDRFKPELPSLAQSRSESERCRTELARLANHMEAFEVAAGERLHGALTLLLHPAVATKMSEAPELQRDCEEMLPIMSAVANQFDQILKMRNTMVKIGIVVDQIDSGSPPESAIRDVFDMTKSLASDIRSMRDSFAQFTYPFSHADGSITIARYLVKNPPSSDDVGGVLNGCSSLLDNLMALHGRCVSRVCEIAEKVERRLGFAPLEAPPAAESA